VKRRDQQRRDKGTKRLDVVRRPRALWLSASGSWLLASGSWLLASDSLASGFWLPVRARNSNS